MNAKIDIIGQQINDWLVLEESVRQRYLVCRCICGNVKDVFKGNLLSGASKSCGCTGKAALLAANITHGVAKQDYRFYSIHRNMMQRCYNPKNKRYWKYGGSGITVQESWHDVATFFSDMYESYLLCMEVIGGNATIERKDNSIGYTSENCTWLHKNSQVFHREPQHRSKTGVSGVRYEEKRNRYVVSWREYPSSEPHKKVFTVSKFSSKDCAFEHAIAYRKQMIAMQRENGAPYPEEVY